MQIQFILFVSLSCLMAPLSAGCGAKPVTDPLAGVGGYRLVYKQRVGKTVATPEIESELRKRIKSQDGGEVVVQPRRGGGCDILLPGANEQRVADVKKIIASENVLQFRIVAWKGEDDELIAACQDGQECEGASWIEYDPEKHKHFPPQAVLTTKDGKSKVLVLKDKQPIDAGHLESATQGRDESLSPCIHCTFTVEGAARMQKLTAANLNRQLAIVMDGSLISAPTIQSAFGSHCQVTGKFTVDEIVSLVTPILQAQIFANLEPTPISEEKVVVASEK